MQFNVFPFKTECTQVVCGVTFANTSVPGVPQSFLLFYECETLAALMGWAGLGMPWNPPGVKGLQLCVQRGKHVVAVFLSKEAFGVAWAYSPPFVELWCKGTVEVGWCWKHSCCFKVTNGTWLKITLSPSSST